MHYLRSILLFFSSLACALPLFDHVPASFEISGESGVTVMHAALMADGKLAFLNKVEDRNKVFQPNGSAAYSCTYDPVTKDTKPLSTVTNPFCCGGAFLADGRLISLGGNGPLDFEPNVYDGFDAIRYLDAEGNQTGWSEPGNKLSTRRWYASAQVMSDGTVFVASGSLNGMNAYDPANNNPTFEILDNNGISKMPTGNSISMDILVRNTPYYMYPFLNVLKDGSLFVFVNKQAQIFDPTHNKVIKELPDLPGAHRTYPSTGGHVMLPLSKANNYDPEIMICGGGFYDSGTSPTDSSCGRIKPLAAKPEWKMTNMSEGRIMVEGVNLLDGTILWVNGAMQGTQGFGVADRPAYNALIYSPALDRWYSAGTSTIARLYHSIAILLRDGTVLITGSNPNEQPLPWPGNAHGVPPRELLLSNQSLRFPTEYRNEIWTPPYLQGDKKRQRPTEITLSTRSFRPGKKIEVQFKAAKSLHSLDLVLCTGGFVTHSLHMGQVMFHLPRSGWRTLSDKAMVVVEAVVPDVKLAPGPYWLYVMANGVPGIGEYCLVEI